ncbi:MAG: hypothetical protein Kow002_09460 [Anaerolineales bacterium]
MNTKREIPYLILALAIGIGLGLVYAWFISPVEYIDATPQILRADFKDDYRTAIAAAYAATGNLERARSRLSVLGDPDPVQALTAQAQRMLAAGEPFEVVEQVAMLASALEGQPHSAGIATAKDALPTSENTPATQTRIPASNLPTNTPESAQALSTPKAFATLRPTRTPTATPGAPFIVLAQETVCDATQAENLLQIIVVNQTRKQMPGAEIIVTWNNGEEHIFTGLKPELGHGYADFNMETDLVYAVRMALGGDQISNLSPPVCIDANGEPYNGGLRVTFQQR